MEEKNEVIQLNLNDIIPNRFQPREVFDEKALKELAVSIKEHGVIQPIIVRQVNGKYEIIAGERRYKASALAGMTKIPAIIRDLDDKESSKVALLENLQRKNLNPIEEARTYQKILEIDQMTQEELAKTMGKSQSAVANKIRLLSLPDEIQEALLKEQISERHARTLLNISDSKKQKDMLKKVINNKMSVRMLEEEIKGMKEDNEESEPKTENIMDLNNEPKQDLELPSINSYINSSPLMPTADIPKEVDNFGKVTIAPPEGEDLPMSAKFLNYVDEPSNDDEDTSMPMLPGTSFNQQDMKSNSDNIPKNDSSADLDNLLNLSSLNGGNTNNNYITEAEKIVKSDVDAPTGNNEDYFKTPDFNGFAFPQNIVDEEESDNSTEEENKFNLDINNNVEEESSGNDVEKGIEKIKELIENLKEKGLNVTADEMNFESSYQVIIKIDKE